MQAIRAMARAGTKVGPAENMPHAIPIIDSPQHVKAAAATRELNSYFLAPMLEGRYDDAYLKTASKNAPKFSEKRTPKLSALWFREASRRNAVA